MKSTLFPWLLGFAVMTTGCTSQYIIVLNTGIRITTRGRPSLRDNVYHFTTVQGQAGQINASRVREVSPTSMVDSPLNHVSPPGK